MSASYGTVYLAITGSLPGLVKIGVTTKDPLIRMKELSAAPGVISPFVLAYHRHVREPFQVEAQIHRDLDECRVNDSREFFSIRIHEAIAMLEVYEEVVPEITIQGPDLPRKLEPDWINLPFSELFATFNDGPERPGTLTVLERAECQELERALAVRDNRRPRF